MALGEAEGDEGAEMLGVASTVSEVGAGKSVLMLTETGIEIMGETAEETAGEAVGGTAEVTVRGGAGETVGGTAEVAGGTTVETVMTAGVEEGGIDVAGTELGGRGAPNSEATQRTCTVSFCCAALVREEAHLVNIDISATGVDLRVVGIEDRGINAVSGCDKIAGVPGFHYVGGGAVLTSVTQAESLAGHQIIAACIYLSVDDGKLVTMKLRTVRLI